MKEAVVPVEVHLTNQAPQTAQALVNHYASLCRKNGLTWRSITVNRIPMSVNHQYGHSGRATWLKPEARDFRKSLKEQCGEVLAAWKPMGAIAAVLLFKSPQWVDDAHLISVLDVDNRIKPIFDAIEECSGIEDERIWDVHAFKVLAKRKSVTVYLFDLGKSIAYHY